MKIVVLDGYCLNPGDLDWKGLEALGECTVYDRTSLTDVEEVILESEMPISYIRIRHRCRERYLRDAQISGSWVCWLPGIMWWM